MTSIELSSGNIGQQKYKEVSQTEVVVDGEIIDGTAGIGSRPTWRQRLRAAWPRLVQILTPILLSPMLFLYWQSKSVRCAYVIAVMAVYWATEVLPLCVTALIPIVAMPSFGIVSAAALCPHYFEDANVMFFSGLMLAVAVERWNLHKRIALRVLTFMGSNPVWILFGFMMITGILSMWISNTGATAMIIPIAVGVLDEMETPDPEQAEETNGYLQSPSSEASFKPSDRQITKAKQNPSKKLEYPNFGSCLCLSVALAANIGGTATLIGCGPTIAFAGLVQILFGQETGVNFISYLSVAFPATMLNLFTGWIILAVMFIGPRKSLRLFFRRKASSPEGQQGATENVFEREYRKLGSMTFAEGSVLFLFGITVLLWVTRKPDIFPGWTSLLGHTLATEASVGIGVCIVMFMWPSRLTCFSKQRDYNSPTPTLLDWNTVHNKLPWSVVLLLGGCFTVAYCCKESGLSADIGNFLSFLESWPHWCLLLMLAVIANVSSTFVGLNATSTILLPIVAELAFVAASYCIARQDVWSLRGKAVHMNPLAPMICITFASCFTYILPVSTPPNAIAYAYKRFTVIEMVKSGIVVSIVHVAILMLNLNTWSKAIFSLETYPDWANN